MTRQTYEDWPLTRLLDAVDRAAEDDTVELRDVLSEIGDRTITPVILVVALLLVSPLSGVPGMPTICAAIIIMLSLQGLTGSRLWLPRWMMRAEVKGARLQQAVGWLRRPADWIDRNSHPRLQALTRGPMRLLILAQCAVIPLGWPALELLPGVTSLAAATVGLFAFGLFARDGYFVIAGYIGMVAVPAGALALLNVAVL
ncbi:exopolysaccharide biosynthesis protein [Roseobacter sinensis]|uniref:Exopolysaccharide biosynthesis protein n=1 Tax=Roseobacter sinensis TaxID=2931391 RepID=A0ABT3B8G1_9RHOB|nr:exopolysaccharide biosynthesis protein [Roseobacter sp. WL0113]MCV3269823.1 exopolysaccharide biosynthesis protein [Roseobacter sp. WL0113]